jgi:hypothetical protein
VGVTLSIMTGNGEIILFFRARAELITIPVGGDGAEMTNAKVLYAAERSTCE